MVKEQPCRRFLSLWERKIEHILPQKWQSSYFPSNSDGEVKELVEHIGNKVPFEKKLNIIASNGYFTLFQSLPL